MLLSGETIDARKALSIGLVSAIVPRTELIPLALERARRIAANPPHAVRLTKRLISEARHPVLRTPRINLNLEKAFGEPDDAAIPDSLMEELKRELGPIAKHTFSVGFLKNADMDWEDRGDWSEL